MYLNTEFWKQNIIMILLFSKINHILFNFFKNKSYFIQFFFKLIIFIQLFLKSQTLKFAKRIKI
jgi:hypothetical protein